jgi:hypothetical protein
MNPIDLLIVALGCGVLAWALTRYAPKAWPQTSLAAQPFVARHPMRASKRGDGLGEQRARPRRRLNASRRHLVAV